MDTDKDILRKLNARPWTTRRRIVGIALCVAVVLAGILMFLQPFRVDAAIGKGYELISDQKETWGSILVYADVNTRIGYMILVDNAGNPVGSHQIENVLGEPQRYGVGGGVMPRLHEEAWKEVEDCDVLWHPQGTKHYHILEYYPSVYTGN
ncbi:hypothetical protein AGMMS49975_23180 [Clostridia bacterium]|nr:hypothetical protein AGMMS49975_23180 [Clostridia bacterium]